ncbi:TlpA family protein disulfide reductase [Microbacterium memoriense]|uniref:TlpA family protein disulfide reductase n=1 Tax=Microbacterium memoriense TaxID=2978350 RepID=A0ABT2PFL2_9MICO|nr:TlpA disulfide reductase family protein [Microbacterium memoriense]MCT9003251.1 TlpA family protein disulfide reductase [Microbacterium memoriense]
MRRRTTAALLLVLALGLSACTSANDGLIDSYEQGGDTGFISGDGSVQEIAADQRGDAVEFTGTAVDGSTVTSADFAGDVLVLNFWYAGCGPCRAEAPTLEATAQKTGAEFLGVNIYDGPEQATAFEETYGISYPSLLAKEDAALKLAFASWTPLQAVPITLVLDAQGRVAARFIGQVASESILTTIVDDVRAEQS